MNDPATPISIDGLRNNISVRVLETSLRNVARQVGMSPTGLEKFLEGSQPYTSVRGKLYEWWSRDGRLPSSEVDAEVASAALDWLVQDLPAPRRPAAVERVLRVLLEAHLREHVVPPLWLSTLLEESGVVEPDAPGRRA